MTFNLHSVNIGVFNPVDFAEDVGYFDGGNVFAFPPECVAQAVVEVEEAFFVSAAA